MAKLVVWLVISPAMLVLPAFAAESVHTAHVGPDQCFETGEPTNALLKRCYPQWLDREQRFLDDRVARALAGFEERLSVAEQITTAHEIWKQYRDAQCKAAGLQYEGGSFQRTRTVACLARVTCERVTDLEKDFYDFVKSDE